MYNLVINIIAYIAIIWFVSLAFWNIVVYVWFKITKGDCKYVGIKRTTYFTDILDDEGLCILPTIHLHLKGMYKYIEITWLSWSYSMYYQLFDEVEEEIEAEIRRKMNNNES